MASPGGYYSPSPSSALWGYQLLDEPSEDLFPGLANTTAALAESHPVRSVRWDSLWTCRHQVSTKGADGHARLAALRNLFSSDIFEH